MAFHIFLKRHDPNAGLSGPWTIPILLDEGIGIASGSVTVVDSNDQPILGTDLVVSNVSVGQIAGQVWGVSFNLDGGSVGFYILRFRFTTDATPAVGDDASMRIRVANN